MGRAKAASTLRVSQLLLSAFLAVTVVAVTRRADGLDRKTVDAMVKEIAAARKTRTQMQSLTKKYGSFSVREAYAIQAALAREMSKSLGPVAGYKVAYVGDCGPLGKVTLKID